MFLTRQRILVSFNRLDKLHPFFGTVFLALKKAGVEPINPMRLNFLEVIGTFLKEYYSPPGYPFIYNPFRLTSKTPQRWNGEEYARSLQAMVEDAFSKVLISENGERWAWQPEYIQALKEYLPDGQLPTFDLAAWLFHANDWNESVQASDVVEAFFSEFHVTEEERVLFDTVIPNEQLAEPGWFQTWSISPEDLWRQRPMGFQPSPPTEDIRLQKLELIGVGPAKRMEFSPTSRLNIITGDNGLGKTFLLECAWWALTGTWASGIAAGPREDAPYDMPYIAAQIGKGDATDLTRSARFDWELHGWSSHGLAGNVPGIPYSQVDTLPLSIFAQADGSFTILDPSKQVASQNQHPFLAQYQPQYEELEPITFSASEVWQGTGERYRGAQRVVISNGLLRDWINWYYAEPTRFQQFTTVLKDLSPDRAQPLVPGKLMRWSVLDAREMPTLKFPYGEIPLIHCSAGIQRIVALAYMLVWTWNEHVITSGAWRKEPRRSLVLLIDEMEAHLHPFWQRVIVPALMEVMQKLVKEVKTQLIIATHSPLVLASVETRFDETRDRLFHLDIQEGLPHLEELPFVKRGRSDLWLISEVFGLKQPRSKEAEEVIEAAKRLQQTKEPARKDVRRITKQLIEVLAPDDEFWPRWTYFASQRGVKL